MGSDENEKKKSFSEKEEPILIEQKERFCMVPIRYKEVWEMYKKAKASIWFTNYFYYCHLHQLLLLYLYTRKTGGDEERMLVLFFNRIGWSTSLPTTEKDAFVKRLLKEKQKGLEEFVTAQYFPLQPGVETFIDDALSGSIHVVILTAYSKNGEKLARSIVEKLGPDRTSKLKIVGKEEIEGSLYDQLVLGKGPSFGLDDEIAKEESKAASVLKQKDAEEVSSILKVSVDLDTNLSESTAMIVATLRAGAEYDGVSVHNCMLIAGGQSCVFGSEPIGIPCIVLRSRHWYFLMLGQ